MKGFKSLPNFNDNQDCAWHQSYEVTRHLGDSQNPALKNYESKIFAVIDVDCSLAGIWWHALKN